MNDLSEWTQQMIREARQNASAPLESEDNPDTADPDDVGNIATGPLSQMLIDNAPLIEAAVNAYGAASVAAFFIDVGAGIATVNGLDDVSVNPTTPLNG